MTRFLRAAALGCLTFGTAPAVLAADVLSSGAITWAACDKGYPTDIRFEKHSKPGRVEVVHDGEGGSVDLAEDGVTIGSDNMAGKAGKPKTVTVTGTINAGTIERGTCSGTYAAN
jgi:hypothetical protein